MGDFQIFVVFHKYIFDECYKNIPDDVLYKNFTFFAVNKNIEKGVLIDKTVDKEYAQNKYKIINEWDLPIYDETFQKRGYNENSAIYHVYMNNLHKDYKYIGFCQYDMTFNDNIINFLQQNITGKPTCFSCNPYDFNFCAYRTWNELYTLNYIIKDYEKFNDKPFTMTCKYPLCNTYIIPSETYDKIMKWVTQLYPKIFPWCIQPPNITTFGHIGGIYERIMAFAVGEENMHYIEINISHDHKYKQLSY